MEWLRQLDEDAESLLNGCDSLPEAPTKQQQVEEELPRLLEKGPVSNQEIIQHFKNKGIQDRTVNLVKGRLNIRSVRKGDKWYWQLNVMNQGNHAKGRAAAVPCVVAYLPKLTNQKENP